MADATGPQWYAQLLRELMDRHHLTPVEIERRTATDGIASTPVNQVTVRRILKGESRTDPERMTLERIARCAGEPYALAFPIRDEGTATIEFVDDDGRKVFVLHVDQLLPAARAALILKAVPVGLIKWLNGSTVDETSLDATRLRRLPSRPVAPGKRQHRVVVDLSKLKRFLDKHSERKDRG